MSKSFFWYSSNSQANKDVEEENSFHVGFSLKGIPAMAKFVGRNTEHSCK